MLSAELVKRVVKIKRLKQVYMIRIYMCDIAHIERHNCLTSIKLIILVAFLLYALD